MKRFLWILLVVLVRVPMSASDHEGVHEELRDMFSRLNPANDTVVVDSAAQVMLNDSIKKCIMRVLAFEGGFAFAFDSVPQLGRVVADDGRFVVYSWNYIPQDRRMVYNCIVQDDRGNIQYMFQYQPYKPYENEKLTADEWYGALYYDVIAYEHRDVSYYVCIGWSRYNRITQYKVIDVLYFDDFGQLRMGFPMFHLGGDMVMRRLVYEYDGQVQMSILYDSKKKRIVMDHLSPMRKIYGREIMGPDLSLDALLRKHDGWVLKEDIKVNNEDDGVRRKRIKPVERTYYHSL